MSDSTDTQNLIAEAAAELSLQERLNQETAKIAWKELQRFFAAGKVIAVEPSLDLVEVAVAFAEDDREAVEKWLVAQSVRHASNDDAKRWTENDSTVWAVVTAPFVLVQECIEAEPGNATSESASSLH